MSEKGIGLDYDEDNSIEFIQSCMPDSFKGLLSNDDIVYLVDLIYEYYEEKGYLSDDAEEEVEIEVDEEDLINYVFKQAKSANIKGLTVKVVEAVMEGELSYCESLEDEEDEYEDEYDEDEEEV